MGRLPTVSQIVVHEVQRPLLTRCRSSGQFSHGSAPFPLWRPFSDLKTSLPVDPRRAFMVYHRTLSAQHGMDPWTTISGVCFDNAENIPTDLGISIRFGYVPFRCPRYSCEATGPTLAYWQDFLHVAACLTTSGRPHHFFSSTICNACLSRLRSATRRFNRGIGS